jgi:hypothetical protein
MVTGEMMGGKIKVCGGLVAFVLITAASPYRAAHGQPLSNLAQVSGSKDLGCPAGRDDRLSPLCAEWKAADASRSSATWAMRAFWASIAAFALLFWTLVETRRTTRETRRIGQEQTRAYVSVTRAVGMLEFEHQLNMMIPRVTLHLNNSGSTPAKNVTYFCGTELIKIGEQELFTCRRELKYLTVAPNVPAGTTHEETATTFGIAVSLRKEEAAWKLITDNTPIGHMPAVVVWGVVFYDDVFDQTFRSEFAFLLPNEQGYDLKTGAKLHLLQNEWQSDPDNSPSLPRLSIYEPVSKRSLSPER